MAEQREVDMQAKLSMTCGDLNLTVNVPVSLFRNLSSGDDVKLFNIVVKEFVDNALELIKQKGMPSAIMGDKK